MRRSIKLVVAIACSLVLPVTASAAAKSTHVPRARLAVTAKQSNGKLHRLNGKELMFHVQVTHGDTVGGLLDPIENAPTGRSVVLPFELHVGDLIEVQLTNSSHGFTRSGSSWMSHRVVAADIKKAFVFDFRVKWAKPSLPPVTDLVGVTIG